MRLVYFILFFTLKYAFWLVYPRRKLIRSPKKFFDRTIYVANHPASFMDPLVIAALRRPIVFFMTRSDVFTPISKPFLWACQMLPIYRQLDGGDTKSQNKEVFRRATNVLKSKRSLLIFGEGFTDDVFIRRLKPVKKGAAKIGFQALEDTNWSKKIYMAGVGSNYSLPNQMRSDLLIATSEKFCLNDYKEVYDENPNKAITEVTRRLEELMREQITHIEDKEQSQFHEQMMMLTRKGMNPDSFDPSISLEDRWKYSKALAHWLNARDVENDAEIVGVKKEVRSYFDLLKRMKLEDKYVFWKQENPSGSRAKELFWLVVLFPFTILGLIHLGAVYYFVKRFAEKSFKRQVFWASVKIILGKIIAGLINIPVIFLFYHFVYESWALAFLYYALIGIFGAMAYQWFIHLKSFKTKGIVKKADLEKIIAKRKDLVEKVTTLTADAF